MITMNEYQGRSDALTGRYLRCRGWSSATLTEEICYCCATRIIPEHFWEIGFSAPTGCCG